MYNSDIWLERRAMRVTIHMLTLVQDKDTSLREYIVIQLVESVHVNIGLRKDGKINLHKKYS